MPNFSQFGYLPKDNVCSLCLLATRGGGGHFHIASDMDVRQIRVRFFVLKSAKGVFLASKVCKGCHFQAVKVLKLRKIIIFLNQITEILRIFFNNAKIYS